MHLLTMVRSGLLLAAMVFTLGCSDGHWDDAGENWKQGSLSPSLETRMQVG